MDVGTKCIMGMFIIVIFHCLIKSSNIIVKWEAKQLSLTVLSVL